jgi:hypothetical protein
MNKILRVTLREMFKNRGVTSVIEQDVCKNVLQRRGWALPRPFLYIHDFFQNKKFKATQKRYRWENDRLSYNRATVTAHHSPSLSPTMQLQPLPCYF